MNKAVFLDRDGVICKEFMTKNVKDIKLLNKVPEAIKILKEKGFKLIVITNQPIIARGLASIKEIKNIHNQINNQINQIIKTKIDRFYFCPHHPNAEIEKYKKSCNCRKPFSGMILQAARDLDLDLKKSWMVGDRITDIIAGRNVGCKTIMVKSPQNKDLIVSSMIYDTNTKADYNTESLFEATKFIN